MKITAVVALVIQRGKVLAVSRRDNHNDLGLPGGKVEPGESLEAALIRELHEETGLAALVIDRVFDRGDIGHHRVRCFAVTEWIGTAKSMEGARVVWVPWKRLLEPRNSFHLFNRALMAHLQGR